MRISFWLMVLPYSSRNTLSKSRSATQTQYDNPYFGLEIDWITTGTSGQDADSWGLDTHNTAAAHGSEDGEYGGHHVGEFQLIDCIVGQEVGPWLVIRRREVEIDLWPWAGGYSVYYDFLLVISACQMRI